MDNVIVVEMSWFVEEKMIYIIILLSVRRENDGNSSNRLIS